MSTEYQNVLTKKKKKKRKKERKRKRKNTSIFLLLEHTTVNFQLEDSKRDYVKSMDSLQSEKDDLNNKLKKANDGKSISL